MTHSQIIQKIKKLAVVPIVRTPDEKSALAAVEAVLAGGSATSYNHRRQTAADLSVGMAARYGNSRRSEMLFTAP